MFLSGAGGGRVKELSLELVSDIRRDDASPP
jgi:hypothetical protein